MRGPPKNDDDDDEIAATKKKLDEEKYFCQKAPFFSHVRILVTRRVYSSNPTQTFLMPVYHPPFLPSSTQSCPSNLLYLVIRVPQSMAFICIQSHGSFSFLSITFLSIAFLIHAFEFH
jgi:DNA primase catalytic subunit